VLDKTGKLRVEDTEEVTRFYNLRVRASAFLSETEQQPPEQQYEQKKEQQYEQQYKQKHELEHLKKIEQCNVDQRIFLSQKHEITNAVLPFLTVRSTKRKRPESDIGDSNPTTRRKF